MSDKDKGLYAKYVISGGRCTKSSNPTKVINAVILEFDDPLARVGIKAFSDAARAAGYGQLADDLDKKLEL